MSYCRWSSDGFQCDVYAYEDVAGCWTIHLASRRHRRVAPLMQDHLRLEKNIESGDLEWSQASFEDYARAQEVWNKEQDELSDEERFIDLNLPHDGESFQCGTLGEFRDKMVELKEAGYLFDDGVIAMINAEVKEFGIDYMINPDSAVPEEHQFDGETRL